MKDWLMRSVARAALNEPLVRLLDRRNGQDANLDPQVAAVLELQRLMKLPALDSMDPVRARRFAEQGLSPLDVAHEPMAEVIDTTVPGKAGAIAIRIFVPHDAGPHWIMYLHGGGGVIGSIRSSEPVTRLLAAQTRCTVASVEYRLGPEHPHPAAIEDACAAFDALAARVPSGGKLAVGGDSFGGFLAANVDRYAREHARRVDLQILIYPLIDLTMSSPSFERFATGYLYTKSMAAWFRANYLGTFPDRRAASPAFWTDHAGAAPAIVITAGFDPLVDEGTAYASGLEAAGTSVRHRCHPGLVHGFLSLAGQVRTARSAIDELCDDIIAVLAS